jgi:ribokinase
VKILARAGENYPQRWLDELAGYGILTDRVRRVAGWQDMRTFYAYVDEKTRVDHNPEIHFARIGQPLPPELEGYHFSTLETQNEDSLLALRAEDVPPGDLSDTVAHLAPGALRGHLQLARQFRRQQIKQITLDPGEYRLTRSNRDDIKELCALVDAFLPSELEVKLLLDTHDVYTAAETFASWGTPLVIIKRGPDGCLLFEREGSRMTSIPPYPANVVDVTGAGDVFGGAFAATLGKTDDVHRAVLMGSVAASFAIEGYGALYALDPPREQVQARLKMLTSQSGLD